MSVAGEVEAYLAAKDGVLSAKSIRDSYGSPLRKIFVPFCEREGIESTAELTPALLDQLRVELLHRKEPRPLSPQSVKSYLKSINVFLGWARGPESRISVALPRTRRQVRTVLTQDEIDLLEATATNDRDRLIVMLAGRYGLRLGELATLKTSGLTRDKDGYWLKVEIEGKTGERRVALDEDDGRKLDAYAARGRPAGAKHVTGLFVGQRQRPGGAGYAPLGAGAIYQIIKDIALRSGLTKRIHPHLLRHSVITHLVAEGTSLSMVAQNTGASIETLLKHYVHHDDSSRHAAIVRARRAR